MTPGTADLALGSPLFTQAVVTLPSGATLTVNAPAAADNAPYVQSATWNGSAWNNAYAPTVGAGPAGRWSFTFGTTANTSWAASSRRRRRTTATLPHLGPLTSGIAGKCATSANSGTANGTHVQLYTCNCTDAQKWSLGQRTARCRPWAAAWT